MLTEYRCYDTTCCTHERYSNKYDKPYQAFENDCAVKWLHQLNFINYKYEKVVFHCIREKRLIKR